MVNNYKTSYACISGVSFYSEVGNLSVGPSQGEFLTETRKASDNCNVSYELKHNNELAESFPYMQFGKDEDGVYEKCDSGHINPRKMVTAQIVGAINQGCDVLRDVVVSLEKNMGTDLFKLTTKSGNTILTRKVLLATNTFTKVLQLLKNPPKFIAMPQTVSFGRISEEDAVRLRLMSS